MSFKKLRSVRVIAVVFLFLFISLTGLAKGLSRYSNGKLERKGVLVASAHTNMTQSSLNQNYQPFHLYYSQDIARTEFLVYNQTGSF